MQKIYEIHEKILVFVAFSWFFGNISIKRRLWTCCSSISMENERISAHYHDISICTSPEHINNNLCLAATDLQAGSGNYRVSHKKIVFRNVVLFLVAGVWVFKIWVILGSKNIHAITRCLELVPNVSTLVCTPLSLYTPLNGHLIRGFAIFLKTILFWDTL